MSDSRGVRIVLGAAALGLAVALLDLMCTAGGPLSSEDLFWHLATGRELWANGVPQGDPFAYTTDRQWALHEWGFQILVGAVDGAAGGWGLRLFGTAAWAGAFGALAWATRRLTRDHAAWLLTLGLALVLLRHRVQLRPQLFSVLGVALLLPALGDPDWRWSRNRLIALAAGVALWINLHSVALLAPILLSAAALGELCARRPAWRSAAVAAAVAAAACFVSPEPLGPWLYAFSARDPVLAFVTDEWAPMWTGPGAGLSAAAYVAFAAGAALWVMGLLLPLTGPPTTQGDGETKTGGWSARVPALAVYVAALPARRFAWLTILPIADGARRVAERCSGPTTWVPALLALAASGLAVADSVPSWTARFTGPAAIGAVHSKFPVAAVELLQRSAVRGNCFTDYSDAGYLLAHCAPNLQVFVDGRTLQYDVTVVRDFTQIRDGAPGREALLERYDTDLVLATREIHRRFSDRWRLIYRDERATLWVRTDRPALIAAITSTIRSQADGR